MRKKKKTRSVSNTASQASDSFGNLIDVYTAEIEENSELISAMLKAIADKGGVKGSENKKTLKSITDRLERINKDLDSLG